MSYLNKLCGGTGGEEVGRALVTMGIHVDLEFVNHCTKKIEHLGVVPHYVAAQQPCSHFAPFRDRKATSTGSGPKKGR